MKHADFNRRRAKRCGQALRRYDADAADACGLIDFLADARHWCDLHGHCFGDLDRIAYGHYAAERNDRED